MKAESEALLKVYPRYIVTSNPTEKEYTVCCEWKVCMSTLFPYFDT